MNFKRKISALVLALSMVSSISVMPVSASNSSDTNYTFTLPTSSYYVYSTEGRAKTDTSPSYVNFGSSTNDYLNTYGVQNSIHGGYNSSTRVANCTSNGTSCIIFPGTARRIHQKVKENGYSYAFLGASAPNSYVAGKTVTGLWSPDSTGSSPFAN